MISRRRVMTLLAGAATAVLAVSLLSACAPTPEPEPTPSAVFASEEEAFAAAEETLLAYIEASNKERNGDVAADSLQFLVGRAVETEISSRNSLREQGLSLSGDAVVRSFASKKIDLSGKPAEMEAIVCLDMSEIRVLSEDAQDVTPVNRPDLGGMSVEFTATEPGTVLISKTTIQDTGC